MLVAITQRCDIKYPEIWMDNLEVTYATYLEQFGIQLIIIPNFTTKLEQYFKLPIEAIILSGGNDIDPKTYRDNITWEGICQKRDQTELKMLELAISKNLPVLGICRGMQLINIYYSGKLVRDINKPVAIHPPGVNHNIQFVNNFKENFGQTTTVNSYHNQAITKDVLASNLRPFAFCENFVEGLYHPTLPIAGVQWHPERKSPDDEVNKKLIEAFVNGELFWRKNKEHESEYSQEYNQDHNSEHESKHNINEENK